MALWTASSLICPLVMLEGIKLEKVDRFIEGMKDASAAPVYNECRQWLLDNLDRFENLTKEDVESISLKYAIVQLSPLCTDVLHRRSNVSQAICSLKRRYTPLSSAILLC